jgi:23S rRNA maturation-related 3'-5' exoribonuclease YhaM
METTKERIIELLRSSSRDNMEDLICWLCNTDFFTAPASMKYHNSYEEGLAEHSLAVYYLLKEKNEKFNLFGEDTCIITGLLHDICKVNFYTKEKKNVKKGTKVNEYGREVANWVEEEVYVVKDMNPLGHGEKSVITIMEFMMLTKLEQAMIRWHMGGFEPKESYLTLNNALDMYPAIAALHTADLEATYLIDKRGEK